MNFIDSTPGGREASDAGWASLHCFLRWSRRDVDTFLVQTLAPLLTAWRLGGTIADWFFVRHDEQGQHLRIRLRGAGPDFTGRFGEDLRGLIAAAAFPVRPGPARPGSAQPGADLPHGSVLPVGYRPEPGRYGGTDALPVAEELFCRSTRIALDLLAQTGSDFERLAHAADLALATALAFDLDPIGAAEWLRGHAAGWRRAPEVLTVPAASLIRHVDRAFARYGPRLAQRQQHVRRAVADAGSDTAPARWVAALRAAGEWMSTPGEYAATGPIDPIWSSQFHMLCNRLGVTPDEERAACWLVASTLLAPDGPPPAEDPIAPDHRYLEASRLVTGAPRSRVTALPWTPRPAGAVVPLPAAALPPASLATVLRTRGPARGRLAGPCSVAELGALLRSSYPTRAARVHVLALRVEGLSAGCYAVDAEHHNLLRVGPPPRPAEIAAAAARFGEDLDIEDVPVLLGLSARLGPLRSRHGLRALRLGLLETGRLTHSLVLAATALGLAGAPVDTFYDEIGHELFGLAGVDEPLLYLLPLGRHSTRSEEEQ